MNKAVGAGFVAHYYLFAAVELVCLALVGRYVWHQAARVALHEARHDSGERVTEQPGTALLS